MSRHGGAGPQRAAERHRQQQSRCQTASPSPPWTLTQTRSRRAASIRAETSDNHSGFSAAAQSSELAVAANWLSQQTAAAAGGLSQLIYCWIPPLSIRLLLARFGFPLRFTRFVSVWPQWSLFQRLTLRSVLIAALQTSKSAFLGVTAARIVGFLRPCKSRSFINAHFLFYLQSAQTFVLCRNRETVGSSRSC